MITDLPQNLESQEEIIRYWDERSKILKVIAHPIRLMILESLCENVKCVQEINELITISQPQLSQHMAELRKAEIISSYSRGSYRCYYLIRPTLIKKLIKLLRKEHPVKIQERKEVMRKLKKDPALND